MTKEERKQIEKTLREYRAIDVKIKNIGIDINRMKNDVSLGSCDMFVEKSTPTNKLISTVENDVIKREAIDIDGQIQKLEAKQKYLAEKKGIIDQAIDLLDDVQREIIKLYYMGRNKITWVNVAMKIGYAESSCKKLNNKALEQLSSII